MRAKLRELIDEAKQDRERRSWAKAMLTQSAAQRPFSTHGS